MEIITEFISKDTVLIRAFVYKYNATTEEYELVDPTASIKVTIVLLDDKKVDAASMEKCEDYDKGVYDYYYNLPSDAVEGWYHGEVVSVDGTGDGAKTSIGQFGFNVERGL